MDGEILERLKKLGRKPRRKSFWQNHRSKKRFSHSNIPPYPLKGKNRAQRERIRRGMMAMG